jgi:hypothetical protein
MKFIPSESLGLCQCSKKNRKCFMHRELLRKTKIKLGKFNQAVTFAPEELQKLTH